MVDAPRDLIRAQNHTLRMNACGFESRPDLSFFRSRGMTDQKTPPGGQWGPVWPVCGMAVTVGVTPVLTVYVSLEHFRKARG